MAARTSKTPPAKKPTPVPLGRKAGKSFLTEELGKKIAKHVEKGQRFYIACLLSGVLQNTGTIWMTQGRRWPNSPQGRFVALIDLANAKAEERAAARIQKGINGSWVAAAWWLTHGPFKREWAARPQAQVTKVDINLPEQIRQKISGMNPQILEAEYERLDGNVKMLGEGDESWHGHG